MVFWDLTSLVMGSHQSSHRTQRGRVLETYIAHRPEDTYRRAQPHTKVLNLTLTGLNLFHITMLSCPCLLMDFEPKNLLLVFFEKARKFR